MAKSGFKPVALSDFVAGQKSKKEPQTQLKIVNFRMVITGSITAKVDSSGKFTQRKDFYNALDNTLEKTESRDEGVEVQVQIIEKEADLPKGLTATHRVYGPHDDSYEIGSVLLGEEDGDSCDEY